MAWVLAFVALAIAVAGCGQPADSRSASSASAGAGGSGGSGGGSIASAGTGGGISCASGLGDCDHDASNGCEVTLAGSDKHHCGACGHDCLGGNCDGGKCLPVVLAAYLNSQGPIYRPRQLALSATHVYWANEGSGVWRVVKGGGMAEQLSTIGAAGGGVAVDAGFFYRGLNDTILRTPLAGGPSQEVKGAKPKGTPLLLDGTTLYYLALAGLERIDSGGGEPVVLAQPKPSTGPGMLAPLAFDGGYVYFLDATHVSRAPTAAPGATKVMGDGKQPSALFAHGGTLYWADWDGATATLYASTGAGSTKLGTHPAQIFSIVADEGRVYFGDVDAHIGTVTTAGTGLAVLYTGDTSGTRPALAIDDKAIYWSIEEGPSKNITVFQYGELKKLAK